MSGPTECLQGVRYRDVSPSHGFAVPAPFRQGGQEDGGRIATGALRPRNDRSRKNLRVIPRPVRRLVVGIRNTTAQRPRRTDCHSQCAHWLRNDTVNKRCCISPGGPMWASTPTHPLLRFRRGDPCGRPSPPHYLQRTRRDRCHWLRQSVSPAAHSSISSIIVFPAGLRPDNS